MGSYADYKKRNAQSAKTAQEPQPQEKTSYQRYKERKKAAGGDTFTADLKAYMEDYQRFATAATTASKNVGYGNALPYLENRNSTARELRDRASKLAVYLHANQESMRGDDYETMLSSVEATEKEIDRIMDYFGGRSRYYSQWDTEEDYNTFVAQQKEHEDMLNFNLTDGEREIEELYAQADTLDWASHSDRVKMAEISDLITQKKAYMENAKRAQEGVRMGGVADPESEYYDPEFSSKAGYISTESNGWGKLTSQYGMGYDDLVYEYINGGQNGMRDKILSKNASFSADTESEASDNWKIYDHMTDDEISIYNYYYNQGGKEAADKYLDSIQKTLNYRSAQARYGKLEDNVGLELLFGAEAGLDQFSSGVKSLFSDEHKAPSDTQILSGMVREDLENAGPKLPDWMGGASLGQVGYDTVTTSANMAPSILTSLAIGAVSKSAGAYVGNALLGASAAGSAYQEKLNQGYTKEQASAYGTMIGLSEVLLEKLLGGITPLGGGGLTEAAVSNIGKIDNILARLAKSAGGRIVMNASSEAFEEGLQAVLEPFLWQAASGIETDVNWEEAAYSALLGFATGGMFEAGSTAIDAAQTQLQYKQLYGESQQELVAKALELNPDNAFAKKMQERLDSGKNLSGSQLNKLVQQNDAAIKKQRPDATETRQDGAETVAEAAQTEKVDTFSVKENNAPEGVYEASEDGKTYFEDKPVTVMGVASIKGGSMKLKLEDGRIVDAKEVQYGSADEAVVYETVANMGVNALAANMLIENYTPGGDVDAMVYAKGIEEAYMAGTLNIPQQELATMPFASELAGYQRQAAYQMGELFGGRQTAKQQATIRKNRTAEGVDTSKGKVHFEGDRNSLNKTQKASLDAMEMLAKALGVQIHVFESEVGADGKRKGANGWYDPSDGSIHIDLYAGADGKGTMLFTVAHELTHFIRQWSPAKLKVLANFLMKQYGEQGASVRELVQNQIDKAKRSGRELTYAEAYEEVIADSMESMLADGSIIEMMAELKQQDKGLWQKIRDWFKDLAGKLKAVVDAYKGVKPDSVEGRLVADMQDMIGTLRALYMDALVDASENFDGGAQKNTAENDSVRYMSRDQKGNVIVDEDVDTQKVRKTLTDIYNGRYKSDNNYFPVLKNTPEVYKQYCHLDADRSFVMAKKKAYKAMQQKNKNQHALGVDGLMYVIENLGTPDYIVYQNVGEYAGNYAAIIISEQREIFAAVQLGEYKDAQYAPNGEKGYYNTLITAFYPNEGYIDDKILIPENDVVYDKNEDPLQVASGVTPSDRAEGSSENSIRNPKPEVKKKLSDRDVSYTENDIQRMTMELSELTAKRQTAEERYNALLNDADLVDAERRLSDMRSNGESRLAVMRSPEYKAVRAERDAIKERLGIDMAKDTAYDLGERERKLRASIHSAQEAIKNETARKAEAEAVSKSGMSEADYFRERAGKQFGYTTDFKYAGYLLPDGQMLDFTSGEGKRDGKRDKDHREIADIYEYTQQSAALLRFLTDGNIRIMAETPGIDLSATHEPTKHQYAEIKRFVREYADKRQFMVDISGEDGRTVGTYTYDGYVNADRVVNDIQYFFQTGQMREKSSIAQFLFSDRDPDYQKVNKVLEQENAKLREDVSELKELVKLQRQVTNGTKFTKTSVEAAARSLKEYADAKGDTKELAGLLNSLYEYIASTRELTWESVKEQAQPVVEWLQQHFDRKIKRSEYAQDILNQLHGSRIYLDESQMAEVAYRFGSYNEFRKRTMGNITFSKDADTSLDTLWQQLSDLYPDVFDGEITSTDMPGKLVDIIDRLRNSDTTALEYARNREMIEQDLLRQVYDSYWRVSTLYTVADVKQREITRLKSEHYQRMEKLRAYHAEKVAQLKQEHKERLEKVRQEYRDRADAKVRKIVEKHQESRKKGVEGRRKTEMRRKIQKVVKKLNDLLLKETKDHHVPDNLKKAVAEALDAINMDTVGADERIAKYDALIAKETDPDVIASLTETRERIAKAGERLADRIGNLKAAYDAVKSGADSASISIYDEVIANKIQEVVEQVGNTALRDMSYEQMEAVYEMYTMVAKSISNANKSFKEAKGATIAQMGTASIREVRAAGGSNQYALKALENAKKFGWDMLKPYYAFSLIGSDTLSGLYDNVRKGEDVWAVDIEEARAFFRQQAEKHGYDRWDLSEEYTFADVSGREFKISLHQIMSLYAYSKRAQADKHLEKGGFVFDSAVEVVRKKGGIPVKYRVNTANAYNLNRMQIDEIVDTLSDEQIAFVDAMQDYLSAVMGEKGNEVSLALYDVRLFKEKNYFPLKSASQYTFQQTENTGDVKLKNSGFSKKTVINASNPIILSDFMNVWGSHVNDMSMYHAFVLPLEDFNRVYNYKTISSEETSTQSVKAALQNAYGVASIKYIKQMLEDINGGARADDRAGILSRWMGKFKKGSVFANASVVIQQPSAIARAVALIEPQHFIGAKISEKRHKQLWEEVKQYAPVAIIKEMGYFDTNMGLSTVEYLTAKDYDTIGEKTKALFADGNYRDELLSRPAALADEISWCYIWEAVKREIKAKNPQADVRSADFLQKTGARFTEVITRTQVYDSVLSRSGLMRSKDTGVKMMTAFMSEPTTSMNMVLDALVQGKRGDRRYARNAVGAVIASQILNSLLVSIVYAARDDDEDKTYAEKYLASFVAKTLDGLNPLSYLPFIKDIVSIARGYTVERSDMAVISDIWTAWQKLPNENVSLYRKIEDFGGSIAQAFGLPVKNMMRDIRAVWQMVQSFLNGPETTAMGIGVAIREEVTGDSVPKHKQLYDAIVNGDAAHLERIAATYEDEATLEGAIRKGLREFDARICEAAEARYNGDFEEYERIFKEIEQEGHFTHSQIAGAIQAEINDMDEGQSSSSVPKKYGMYNVDDFMIAVCTDDHAMAGGIREKIIRTGQENGKSPEKAEEAFINSVVSACKDRYLAGQLTWDQTVGTLTKYCGRSKNEAHADIAYWTYKRDNPDAEVSPQWFDTYYEKVESSGIDVDTYIEYRDRRSGYTKKADILEIIDGMDLTDKQKDALYYAEGWAKSTLDEAPWH